MKREIAQRILAKTQADYQKIAEEFSASRARIWPELEQLASYVKEGQKVLDVGCGNGRLWELFKNRAIEYAGIDNCFAFIQEARRKYHKFPRATFKIMDALHLNWPHNTFDLVFCVAVLSHLPSRSVRLQVLNNIHRVLKPEGYLILTVWNLWQFNFRRKSWWRFTLDKWLTSRREYQARYGLSRGDLGPLDILTLWQKNGKKAVLYYYAFTLGQLKGLVKEAGFQVVEAFYIKKGERVSWYNGYNLVVVAKK